MNRRGASGVDGETTKEFEQGLGTRVQDLCERLKRGAYRAPPRCAEWRYLQGTCQGRYEAARNSDRRRPPAAKGSCADIGSGVRGGFSGMLVWISAWA